MSCLEFEPSSLGKLICWVHFETDTCGLPVWCGIIPMHGVGIVHIEVFRSAAAEVVLQCIPVWAVDEFIWLPF